VPRGGSLMSRKPSITIWPDSVAVTVEFKPQHRSAMPNSVGAIEEPSSGREKRVHLVELGERRSTNLVKGGGPRE